MFEGFLQSSTNRKHDEELVKFRFWGRGGVLTFDTRKMKGGYYGFNMQQGVDTKHMSTYLHSGHNRLHKTDFSKEVEF